MPCKKMVIFQLFVLLLEASKYSIYVFSFALCKVYYIQAFVILDAV